MASDMVHADPAAQALGLYAHVLSATSLASAAHQLVTQLARLGYFDRVTLALHEAGQTRLLASSTSDISQQAHGELAQALLGAMGEVIDQGVPLGWPAPNAIDNAIDNDEADNATTRQRTGSGSNISSCSNWWAAQWPTCRWVLMAACFPLYRCSATPRHRSPTRKCSNSQTG